MHEIKNRTATVEVVKVIDCTESFLQVLAGGDLEKYAKKLMEECGIGTVVEKEGERDGTKRHKRFS